MTPGALIRRRRQELGLSQNGLAKELSRARWGAPGHCSGHQVYRWEKGRREPREWRPYLEDVLGIDLSGYRGSTAPDAEADVEGLVSPVDRRALLGAGVVAGIAVSAPQAAARGRHVGKSDVRRASQRLSRLRRLDDLSGGVAVHPKVVEEIQGLTRLAREGTYGDGVARELLSTLAELYQFASWTAFDAGKHAQAARLAQAAASTAVQAGNPTLSATALSELSYITASSSNPRRGVEVAEASWVAAPKDALPAVRVVLADRMAWAYARTGNAAEVDRALGLSADAHDQRDRSRDEEPDTVYWINRDESDIMAGRCWAELRNPKKAVPILAELTTPYDDSQARELGLHAAWLAGSQLDAGSIEEATATATKAVTLSFHTASPRLNTLVDATVARFEPHRKNPEVRDLLNLYAT